MRFLEAIGKWVRHADAAAIMRARIVGTLACALAGGVVWHHHTAPAQSLTVAAPIVARASLHAVPEPRTQSIFEEGDALLSEQSFGVVPAVVETAAVPTESPAALSASHLSARAVMVTDASGTALFEKNGIARLPIASLTKLMTAVVVLEHVRSDDAVPVTAAAVATDGIAGGLRAGETIAVLDLLKIMLIVSSNDAAAAFTEHFTAQGMDLVALMNEKAKTLGMTDTHFANPHGLDADGHYGTAADLAKLTAYSFTHRMIWDILSEASDTVYSLDKKIAHRLLSNNKIVRDGNPAVLGGKTGYTTQALECMITKLKTGEIIVVLGSKDRAGETETLIHMLHD